MNSYYAFVCKKPLAGAAGAVCLHFCYRAPLVAMVDSMFLSIIWPAQLVCTHFQTLSSNSAETEQD